MILLVFCAQWSDGRNLMFLSPPSKEQMRRGWKYFFFLVFIENTCSFFMIYSPLWVKGYSGSTICWAWGLTVFPSHNKNLAGNMCNFSSEGRGGPRNMILLRPVLQGSLFIFQMKLFCRKWFGTLYIFFCLSNIYCLIGYLFIFWGSALVDVKVLLCLDLCFQWTSVST